MNYNQQCAFIRHCNNINAIPILNNEDRVEKLCFMKLITQNYYNKAKQLYDIANEIYTGQCDLQLWPKHSSGKFYNYTFVIIIKFDKLTVRNNQNGKIDITDMFFAMELVMIGNTFTIGDFSGNRTTFSYVEAISRYKFSHLPKVNLDEPSKYSNFCFGDGDIPLIRTKFNQVFPRDMGVFRLLLFNIESYLSWESTEGGPYIRISDVFNQSNLWTESLLNNNNIKGLSDSLFKYMNSIDCDVIIRNGNYLIADNEKFDSSLVSIVSTYFNSDNKKLLLFRKGSDNKLYQISTEKKEPVLSDMPVIFQQRKYYYTITDAPSISESDNYHINPTFKNHVKSILEYKFNQKIIESNFVKQLQDQVEV